jgi:predicted  nucleic acid-binding Zn-ribbon protein
MPAMAADAEFESVKSDHSWSLEQAEAAFFERLAREEKGEPQRFESTTHVSTGAHRLPPLSRESSWCQARKWYAVGALLFVTVGFCAYRIGVHRGTSIAKLASPRSRTPDPSSPEAQLSDAGRERQLALAEIEQQDNVIADLRRQLSQRSVEIQQMKAARERLENDLRASDAVTQDLARERTEIARELDEAQTNSQALQQQLDSAAQQSAEGAARAKASEAKANELTRLLHDREAALEQKDELLAHDRDIRELMGARDLYVAEIYDVARSGATQKTYGRVFYTRGKSLIFYAYDLDQQATARSAATFQAWGRRGPDRQQALNLGVFYEDNASKKRWIMKCDDPKTLAQIDAVFVTMEPSGGSHKPSGKSLLFAYLRVDPNHP